MKKILIILFGVIMLSACSGADNEYEDRLKEAERKLEEAKEDTERLEGISDQIDETTELLEEQLKE